MMNARTEKVKERINKSLCVNFMLGTFFTVVTCLMVYRGVYFFLIALVPLVIAGIRKMWKQGELKGEGTIGLLYMVFITIPTFIYLLYDAYKNGIYVSLVIGAFVLFPILKDLINGFFADIRGE